MTATAAYAQNTANPIQGENGFRPLAWCSQMAEPALNGIHLSMSAWPNQPLGGPGRNWLRIHSTNMRPIPAAIAPAECLSIAPRPYDRSPQTARNSPPPITVRSTSGCPSVVLTCWLDRIRWATQKGRKLVTSPTTSATAPKTTPLAANTVPRRGIAVSDVLIIPVEYSELIVSAPSTMMISCPMSSPNRLMLAAEEWIWAETAAATPGGTCAPRKFRPASRWVMR